MITCSDIQFDLLCRHSYRPKKARSASKPLATRSDWKQITSSIVRILATIPTSRNRDRIVMIEIELEQVDNSGLS